MITKLINLLTFSRIIFAIVIFIFLALEQNYLFALLLFFISGLTDFFDGFLARKYKTSSELGEILDPLADKILIIFVFIGLAVNLSSFVIGFAASLIISREIWISVLRDFNARNNNTNATKVIYIAKIKTSIQLFTIFIYLCGLVINNMLLIIIGDIFIVISVLITIYTGYIYTKNSFNKN